MKSQSYPIPSAETQAEIEILNSRFLATITPVFSVEEAKSFIRRIKQRYPDASHNVPAYLIGHGATVIAHCNDDGEPAGTAGRPSLAVLQGSGLGDVAVVTSRYFGGTKLGTGGLVRAYGDAVKAVLERVTPAIKVEVYLIMLVFPYTHFERIEKLVALHRGKLLDTDFSAEITLSFQLEVAQYLPFAKALEQLSHGSLSAEIIEKKFALLTLD